ncbi:MAG TPA: hypothetical protein DCQ98_14200 [Planctomycetaceae bacterium]|nr:hypothetical protein [Planctomycetaceae bacterium]
MAGVADHHFLHAELLDRVEHLFERFERCRAEIDGQDRRLFVLDRIGQEMDGTQRAVVVRLIFLFPEPRHEPVLERRPVVGGALGENDRGRVPGERQQLHGHRIAPGELDRFEVVHLVDLDVPERLDLAAAQDRQVDSDRQPQTPFGNRFSVVVAQRGFANDLDVVLGLLSQQLGGDRFQIEIPDIFQQFLETHPATPVSIETRGRAARNATDYRVPLPVPMGDEAIRGAAPPPDRLATIRLPERRVRRLD